MSVGWWRRVWRRRKCPSQLWWWSRVSGFSGWRGVDGLRWRTRGWQGLHHTATLLTY